MSDIRKRPGAKGTTYQVRFPSKAAKSGYAYATFATRKEALEFRENGSARTTASRRSSEIQTVEQGLTKWLHVCEKEGRDGREPVTQYTLDNYTYRASIIKKYDWDKGLADLAKSDIIEFRSWLLQHYSRDVAHKVLKSFHSMILEMITRTILQHDVAAGVCVRAESRYDVPVSIPTEREISALLSAADRLANSRDMRIQEPWKKYRPMLYLAVDSGMRPQEYLALARANVSDTGVEVDRALDGGGDEITVTKTRAGRRFIDLSAETLDIIQHFIKNHSVKNDYDLVFPSETGGWQSVRNWRRRGFNRACEEAGLVVKEQEDGKLIERPKYKPYDLRHFYASMLIDQRINLKRIQKLMGHRSIQTTLDVYGHLIERADTAPQPRTSVLTSMQRIPCG